MSEPPATILSDGDPATLGELASRLAGVPAPEWLDALRADQAERWRAGAGLPAEAYLAACPAFRTRTEDVLVLIWGEVLLRSERGETPERAEYQRRFPDHADTLAIQFDLEQHLETRTLPSAAVPPAATAPTFSPPGYEVLEELGRGGMGVVFKARQLDLDRVVALKVIRDSELAGASERLGGGFRAEAQAVARLQHPHVVQVHQVGEHAGRPFLVLEYVEGGNLADLVRDGPLPPQRAAELVEALARAVQAAHETGIIHRDLKPANVLLTRDGTPKVTDFGLARRLDANTARQTQTGAVVGTPSYMAPEQAEGKKDVGPLADVYGLGAILYECLTGQPPFRAATPFETVLQVVSEEPRPPRQLNARVPRDLETICLKCLRKRPGDRYASAHDLADDLERHLADRPVLARPAGRLQRGWRWCRLRPWLAGPIAATLLLVVAGGPVAWYLAGRGNDQDAGLRDNPAQSDRDREDAEARAGHVHAERALRLFNSGELAAAVKEASEAARLSPRHEWAIALRAMAHSQLGEHRLALDDAEAALRLSPKSVDSHNVRCASLVLLGRWDEAVSAVRASATLLPIQFPEDSVLLVEAGALVARNDREGYRRLCAGLPRRANTIKRASQADHLARIWMLGKDPGTGPAFAEGLAERALKASPITPWFLHTRGMIHYRAGDPAKAVKSFEESLKQPWTGHLVNWLGLALAHHALGQQEEARRWREKALRTPVTSVHPHEAVAYQLLRREVEELLKGQSGKWK